ncbi:MAG TPA: sugar ABC transporter permease [Albidovulum sp.]|uniref:carbohydrate ABC transporter permease n=1 Tax=Albidovulum sp. TaxID=1872424 RepID=UPI002CE15519|nr:sugar ABC transporter permease [Albidovulum sp.]
MLHTNRFGNLKYVLPALLVYTAFVLLPIIASIVLGFTEWGGIGMPKFVGLANYAALLSDPMFFKALRNTAVLMIFYVALPLCIGLALAAAISHIRPGERMALRMLYFMPYVMPSAVLGIIWRWLYNPIFGPLNQVLRAAGLGALALPWLGDFNFALPAVGMVATWYYVGFCMAIFMAGLQRIDASLFEAASLEGASGQQTFRYVTLPSLLPEIRIVLLLTIIASIKSYDLIFTMTRGGPANETLVSNLYMYQLGFELNRYGYASAVAVIGAIFILVVNGIVHRFLPTDGDSA